MRRQFASTASALVAVLTLSIAGSTGASATGTANPPTFALNQVGPQNGGGEPSVAVGPEGTIYVSAPGGGTEFYRSADHGVTWTKGATAESPSGDTSVNVDHSGAVYQSNLNVIVVGSTRTLQADVFKSFDKGSSWPQRGQSALQSNNSTGNPFFVDRPWVDAYIAPGGTTDSALVYIEYHDFGPSQVWISKSADGGKTFGLPGTVITSPIAQLDSYCNTIPGGVKVVQSGPHAGRVYAVWLAADPANPVTGCNLTQLAAFHSVWVAYSDDQGATWTDQLVYDPGPLHDGSEIFADLTLDNAGNPYIAFSMNVQTQFDVWVEASFDGGATWNGKSDGTGQPFKVNQTTGTHYFAAIAAGKPGKVDVAFLRTDVVVPATVYGKPTPGADANASWDLYMAQSRNLLSGAPTWQNFKLTPSPMHVGDICTLGLFCAAIPNSNRNILDFIDIAADAHGFAHIAYTDDNNYPDGAIVMANQVGGRGIGPGGH